MKLNKNKTMAKRSKSYKKLYGILFKAASMVQIDEYHLPKDTICLEVVFTRIFFGSDGKTGHLVDERQDYGTR